MNINNYKYKVIYDGIITVNFTFIKSTYYHIVNKYVWQKFT